MASGLHPLQYVTYGAALRELQGSLCALFLVLHCIVALLANGSGSVFALILTNHCRFLLFAFSLAYMLFLLAPCLYVTQTTALQPVLTLDPCFKVFPGGNSEVLPSSANDVGSPSHQTSILDVQYPAFFRPPWLWPLNRCSQPNELNLQ